VNWPEQVGGAGEIVQRQIEKEVLAGFPLFETSRMAAS